MAPVKHRRLKCAGGKRFVIVVLPRTGSLSARHPCSNVLYVLCKRSDGEFEIPSLGSRDGAPTTPLRVFLTKGLSERKLTRGCT